MMKVDGREIFGFGNFTEAERTYLINGVVYMVSSRFMENDTENQKDTITNKAEKFIGSDFAHLTIDDDSNKMNTEYISTAGKEY